MPPAANCWFRHFSGNHLLFSSLTRFQLFLAFIALLMLRIVVGFHFFKEGTNKLRDGDFTAEYFLRGAKGPAAPYFQKILRDDDGRERLCIKESIADDGDKQFEFDTEQTFSIWDDFIDGAFYYYQFGNEDLQGEIAERRNELADQIKQARAAKSADVNTAVLEEERKKGEASILRLRAQHQQADEIFAAHKEQLTYFLEANRAEIYSHFGTEDRLQGFERDGENREKVATYVDSLRTQVDTIRSDRSTQLAGWTSEVEGIWDSLETQINSLATDKQANKPPIKLHRPYAQPNGNLQMLNRFIPWFDTTVGVLLILGLFTRFASLAGAGFLLSVIATQPPWIPGTTPTYYQAIELFALLVIFATCAGRIGGLDYLFSSKKPRTSS